MALTIKDVREWIKIYEDHSIRGQELKHVYYDELSDIWQRHIGAFVLAMRRPNRPIINRYRNKRRIR